jgi:type II secretory pathway predicted ATPase ExeA
MTILEHFKLKEYPFSQKILPEFIFDCASQNKILLKLQNKVRESAGVFKISGRKGVGKSFLCSVLEKRLNNNEVAISFNAKDLGEMSVYEKIGKILGISKKATLENLFEVFSQIYGLGKNIIIIVDDVDFLSLQNWLYLDDMYNYKNKLRLVLVGGKKISQQIRKNKLVNLAQNMVYKEYLVPFSFTETYNYIKKLISEHINYKVELPMTNWAMFILSFCGQGIAKNINLLGSEALEIAYKKNKAKVNGWLMFKIILRNYKLTKPFIPRLMFKIMLAIAIYLSFIGGRKLFHELELQYHLSIERNAVEKSFAEDLISDNSETLIK